MYILVVSEWKTILFLGKCVHTYEACKSVKFRKSINTIATWAKRILTNTLDVIKPISREWVGFFFRTYAPTSRKK